MSSFYGTFDRCRCVKSFLTCYLFLTIPFFWEDLLVKNTASDAIMITSFKISYVGVIVFVFINKNLVTESQLKILGLLSLKKVSVQIRKRK